MKKLLFILLICMTQNAVISQSIVTYPQPPQYLISENPPIIPPVTTANDIPANYNVGQNTDFSVRVMGSDSMWNDLFVYNAFVNSSQQNLSASTRSSFVTFDSFQATTIEITCNYLSEPINSVIIRPLSKPITPTINGNKITFQIRHTGIFKTGGKFSVEINGNRYRNLQIFANKTNQFTAPTATITYNAGVHIYDTTHNYNEAPKKILIKSGAVLIAPYETASSLQDNGRIVMRNNDELFFESGAILKGGILIEGRNNVKVTGNGIIDISNYRKQYDSEVNPYAYIQGVSVRNSTNITLDGFIINDSQQVGIELTDSDNITINNIKVFSRCIWGDGINMRGTSNVNIDDCYLRTSDDCTSIHASKYNTSDPYLNRDAININVSNSLLYADNARPIQIGSHGNNNQSGLGLNIYDIKYTNIDILEHDEDWPNYLGAISVTCGDGNTCDDILFKDIRVEDFTMGCLFTVDVDSGTAGGASTSDGAKVSYIRFENLSYNGCGENPSSIKGLDCLRPVDGVHFENFKVNNVLIENLSNYNNFGYPMIQTNQYAYNITFNEANNYGTDIPSGWYRISTNSKYLTRNTTDTKINTKLLNSSSNLQKWYIENLNGHYKIKSAPGELLTNSELVVNCDEKYVIMNPEASMAKEEWKIVKQPNTSLYTINNAYTRSYLQNSAVAEANIFVRPKDISLSSQKWTITPTTQPSSSFRIRDVAEITEKTPSIYPNPFVNVINIGNMNGTISIKIINSQGQTIIAKQLNASERNLHLDNLDDGFYFIIMENVEGQIFTRKLIKTH